MSREQGEEKPRPTATMRAQRLHQAVCWSVDGRTRADESRRGRTHRTLSTHLHGLLYKVESRTARAVLSRPWEDPVGRHHAFLGLVGLALTEITEYSSECGSCWTLVGHKLHMFLLAQQPSCESTTRYELHLRTPRQCMRFNTDSQPSLRTGDSPAFASDRHS